MKKILFAIIISLTACMACQDWRQQNETSDAPDSTALKFGVLPTMDCLPFYVAKSLGIYDSLGLNIRLHTFQAATDADTALLNGCLDGCVSDLVRAAQLHALCDSIRVVMDGELELYLMTTSTSRVRTLENLKDKIIGATRHSAPDMMCDRIVGDAKLDELDLNRPQINNIHLRSRMVVLDQYDGAILPEPYASMCEAVGAFRLTDTRRLGVEWGAVTFRGPFDAARTDEVRLFLQAYNMAVDSINAAVAADRASRMLALLPVQDGCPDSIVKVRQFRHASLPTEETVAKVNTWIDVRNRVWLKSETPRLYACPYNQLINK